MRLDIALAAKIDLQAIQAFGEKRFGKRQATVYLSEIIDLFDLLCVTPEINRVRPEFGENVRLQQFEAHVIFYRIVRKTVVIERILSRYQNWPVHRL
jgi:plasmid stabilization system protein ParE